MKRFFFLVLMGVLSVVSHVCAKSLPQETSQSIGIIEFVLKNSKYEDTKCDIHSCLMKSKDGGVSLTLTHATMKQDKEEDLHYLLKINVQGTLFSTKVEVRYRNDPSKQTMKTGKRSDEVGSSYKTEHRVMRSWIQFIKDSTTSKS